MRVLLVCFANVCRSPAAAALLERATNGEVTAVSRGLAGGPDIVPEPLLAALAAADVEVRRPVGVRLDPSDVASAQLCLFMERRILREVVVAEPGCWPRAFTLREFARRALESPPTEDDATFARWLARVHRGRSSEQLLGSDPGDDVLDPGLGADEAAYATMIAQLRATTSAIAPFLTSWPST